MQEIVKRRLFKFSERKMKNLLNIILLKNFRTIDNSLEVKTILPKLYNLKKKDVKRFKSSLDTLLDSITEEFSNFYLNLFVPYESSEIEEMVHTTQIYV